MSKVVLHIGTHKTATTTIQDTFWANSQRLAERGLIYPRLSDVVGITGHHGLVYDWVQLPPIYKLKTDSLGALARIAEAHAGTDATVFLSSEEFSRGDPNAMVDFDEVRRVLAPFDEIEVICTLRPQWQFLQSVYLELSKKRVPPRPPQLVKPVIERGMFAGLWVDYNLLLDRLEASFDPGQITLLDFHASRAAPGGILGTLLRHLKIDIDPAALETVNEGKSNVSPMSLGSWVANILAEPKVAPHWLVGTASDLLREQYGQDVKPCLFTREEFRLLKTHFDALNARLAKRRATVQPGFAISESKETDISLFRNEINANFWVHVSRYMVAKRL